MTVKNKTIEEQGLEFTMERRESILGRSLIHTSHKTSENQNNSLRERKRGKEISLNDIHTNFALQGGTESTH